MKRIVLVLLMAACFGLMEVKALDPISVSTCGVSVSTTSASTDTYKAKITSITSGAPLPSTQELSLKVGEQKTFGVISYSSAGLYEYKVTLDKSDTYFIYTVQIIDDNGVLHENSFAKEKGTGEKLTNIKFTIDNTPKKEDRGGIINPYTADVIFKFVIALIISGALIFFVIMKLKDNKNEKAQ